MNFNAKVNPQGHTLRTTIPALFLLTLALPACKSAQSRAQEAYARYQVATAANDLAASRRALLDLVSAKDDVAENWSELGKLDVQMGNYRDAYSAFNRAHELDRANPEILRILTQLALRGGDARSAQRNAQELDIVAPGDPWVKITAGYSALSQHRFDEALSTSDAIMKVTPDDPSAIVLKARSFLGLGRNADALKLLQDHVHFQPGDIGSWRLIARLYERATDWPNVAKSSAHLLQSTPLDRDAALLYIKASFQSGDIAAARRESLLLLQPNADPALVSAILDRWADYWTSDQRAGEARRLGQSAKPAPKLAYAAFLNRIDRPVDALALAAPYASLPVRADNVDANAIVADSWAKSGRAGEAKSRLDAVLVYDSGNALALRSRAELLLRVRQAPLAILDAQKLVTVAPQSARDRILLSQCYAAAGNVDGAKRVLWDAFQDIKASELLFLALKRLNATQPDMITQVNEEYALQLDSALSRGLL